MVSVKGKMWVAILGAIATFVGFGTLANQAIYVAWRSAFEGAPVDQLRQWFYIYSAGSAVLLAVCIWLVWIAWRLRKAAKQEYTGT